MRREQPAITIKAVSCGLTVLRDDDSADTVFDRADAALYKAKNSGRNVCIAV